MHRSHVLGILAALLCAAVACFFLLRGGEMPEQQAPTGLAAGSGDESPLVAAEAKQGKGDGAVLRREAVPVGKPGQELDPGVAAALSGFRGRVVDHKNQPVAETGVRIYRFALDKVLGPADL